MYIIFIICYSFLICTFLFYKKEARAVQNCLRLIASFKFWLLHIIILERKEQYTVRRTGTSAFTDELTLVFTLKSLINIHFQILIVLNFTTFSFRQVLLHLVTIIGELYFMCITVLLYTMMNLIQWGWLLVTSEIGWHSVTCSASATRQTNRP